MKNLDEALDTLKRRARIDNDNYDFERACEAQGEVEALLAAIKPFAEFSKRYLSMPGLHPQPGDHVYQAWDAKILVKDLQALLEALGE